MQGSSAVSRRYRFAALFDAVQSDPNFFAKGSLEAIPSLQVYTKASSPHVDGGTRDAAEKTARLDLFMHGEPLVQYVEPMFVSTKRGARKHKMGEIGAWLSTKKPRTSASSPTAPSTTCDSPRTEVIAID